MNVACSSCNTQYKIDESKVPPSGGFIKCKTCGERVKIPPPGSHHETPPPEVPPVAPPEVPPVAPPETAPVAPEAPPEAASATPEAASSAPPEIPPPAPPTAPPEVPPALPSGNPAIPLAGTEPLESPAALDLASLPEVPSPDEFDPLADTAPTNAIPLAGTSSSVDDDDAPTQVTLLADEAPTVVAATPSLPPSGLPPGEPVERNDEAPTVVSPIAPPPPEVAETPADDDDAPTQVTETPKFLDNLPPTLEDLPAALTEETPAPTEGEEPADADASLEASLFDDLPTASLDDVTDPDSLQLDLPTPETAADDLPAKAPSIDNLPGEAPSLMDDLPSEAPSLMDDVAAHTPGSAEASSGAAESANGQVSAPAIHPADLGGIPAADATPDAEATRPNRRRLFAIAGVGSAVVLLAVVALITPYLGVQVVDPLGLAAEPGPAPTDPEPQAKAKAKSKTKSKTKAKAPPPEPAPPAPEVAKLSAENIDSLSFAALRAALADEAADGEEGGGLLAWARFRLASHGDEDARDALAATLPKRPNEITKMDDELAAAAALGGLALTGKTGPARRVGERLQRSRFKESPHFALALSTAYTRRPELAKALRQVERARKLSPDLRDAALRRGLLLLNGRESEAGANALVEVASEANDPDVTVLVAGALLDANQFSGLSQVAATLEDAKQIESVAPHRRDLAHRILCYHNLRAGNLEQAAQIAATRTKTNPSPDLRIEHARLTAASGGDGDAPLKAQAEELAPTEAARFLAERVRLALRAGNLDTAKAVLAEKDALGKKTGGWTKLAAGWIAKQEDDADAAKAAFSAAAKKKLAEARLEVVLLSTSKPGPLTKKLTDLEKKFQLPAASYHLAKVMRGRGNAGGAAELLERVLWTDPTIVDPVELVLEWAETAALAGQAERAKSTVASIRANRPDDLRPAMALIELEQQAGKHAEAVTLFRELLAAKPGNASLTVGLAAALNRSGSQPEAQGLLDELFKTDKSARTPEALVELARSWADREPYRARQLVRESIDSKPTAEKFMLLGVLAEKREQIDEARMAYNKAIELDDTTLDAYVALAYIDLEARAFDKVVPALEKVLQQQPSHREAAIVLGDVYVETGKPREAIKRYEAALSVRETEAVLMKVARLQLQRLGQLALASKTLRRVIAKNPKQAEAHFHLGMALKDQDQPRDAAASLQKCLALEPEGEWADEAKRTLQDLGYP